MPEQLDRPAQLACVRALVAIAGMPDIHVAMSAELTAEWLKKRANGKVYASAFALTWLSTMRQSQRLSHVAGTNPQIDLQIAAVRLQGSRKALAKDAHVIATALNSDRRCLSRDDKMRDHHLPALAQVVPEIGELQWVNPGSAGVAQWIGSAMAENTGFKIRDTAVGG